MGERLRQDAREEKNKERLDWEPGASPKRATAICPDGMERSRDREIRESTAGVKASGGCHRAQGPVGRPSPNLK